MCAPCRYFWLCVYFSAAGNPDTYSKIAKLRERTKERIVRTFDTLILFFVFFFKLITFYLAGKIVICPFWLYFLFTPAFSRILPALSQGWDLSILFAFLSLNCCCNKSSEVESWSKVERSVLFIETWHIPVWDLSWKAYSKFKLECIFFFNNFFASLLPQISIALLWV